MCVIMRLYVCLCMCACVRASVHACVCVCWFLYVFTPALAQFMGHLVLGGREYDFQEWLYKHRISGEGKGPPKAFLHIVKALLS